MDQNGGEKRKADEMVADTVEVPLGELRDVAEKAGEGKTWKDWRGMVLPASHILKSYCTRLVWLSSMHRSSPFRWNDHTIAASIRTYACLISSRGAQLLWISCSPVNCAGDQWPHIQHHMIPENVAHGSGIHDVHDVGCVVNAPRLAPWQPTRYACGVPFTAANRWASQLQPSTVTATKRYS